MNMGTFSILMCNLKSKLLSRATARLSSKAVSRSCDVYDSPNPQLLREVILPSMVVYEDFITPHEEQSLVAELDPLLRRLIYETAHWDDAIKGYRETEMDSWTSKSQPIIDRIRSLAFPPEKPQLKRVHILDLKKSGHIRPHIDSVKFCGDTIASLSLLSPCVMRLVHQDHAADSPDEQSDWYVDILIPQRSLYVMSGPSRYEFTHEVLPGNRSLFRGNVVSKSRRISVICRSEVVNDKNTDDNVSPQSSEPLRYTKL